ncbi:hypothetical protein [Microvirga vignae]|nr:hypothetical protein [Microvirga vignae]
MSRRSQSGTTFAYHVGDPAHYCVAGSDREGRAVSNKEQPAQPTSIGR